MQEVVFTMAKEKDRKFYIWWTIEPAMGRVAHGVAHRVDRLRAIGNGQVPAVAAAAFNILRQKLKEVCLISKRYDRIKILFKLMEYDYITDKQHELVESFEQQFERRGDLSDRQLEILESINQQANERDRPYRR